ncbi:MAG: hypothetical protein CMO55_27105 [Verrucomicrobiales bacterium]|nr:hypothetical protein [Verrucomicrobiales bacterium]
MSFETKTSGSTLKLVLGTVGVFAFFGFLTLILSGFVGHESLEDRAYKGEFDQETIDTRWANLKEVSEAQSGAIDEEKLSKAMVELVKAPAAPKKSEIVIPGSPTFLKQSQQPAPEAEAAPAEDKPAEDKPAAPEKAKEEAKPAPKPEEKKPEAASKEKEKAKAAPAPKAEPAAPKPAEKEKAAPKAKAKEKAAPKEQPKAE